MAGGATVFALLATCLGLMWGWVAKTTGSIRWTVVAHVLLNRHPLYSSLLFLAWGAFFKHPSWVGVSLVLIATFFLTMTARVEETENMHYFDPAYQSYMKRTKMFVPFLF